MARDNNFLLGRGERLTAPVIVPSGGSEKNPPYTFSRARQRLSRKLSVTSSEMSALPDEACPQDEAVAIVTLHPRYIAKSDFPRDLLDAVGLRAIGSRLRMIQPEQWGTRKHPIEAYGEDLFVAGPRSNFYRWTAQLPRWDEASKGADKLVRVEDISVYSGSQKLRHLPADSKKHIFEVVLHNAGEGVIFRAFEQYARSLEVNLLVNRRHDVKGLTFVPAQATVGSIRELANFTFVRVARSMPTLRPLVPGVLRASSAARVVLPEAGPIDLRPRVLIFDGGLPPQPDLSKWVRLIEPEGIGPAVSAFQQHGLAVTSAFLFGSLEPGHAPATPLCHVDHVRVLDSSSGSDTLEYLDVLDRILTFMDGNADDNDFINICIGPDFACLDDEVSLWTAALDERLALPTTLTTVAAGNDGERDSDLGLNRIQPPADGVNVLSVGAADSRNGNWGRAIYSCVGPGRTPGIVKPDGVGFGGSDGNPFMVLAPLRSPSAVGIQGTSFAAPLVLRSGVSVRVQLGNELNALAIRALMIHRAECQEHSRRDVGWGRFTEDFGNLITCDDDEALVVFQGVLPVGQSLRAPVPLPSGLLQGKVKVEATLLIAPRVDPEHPGSYTQSGVEVAFRPHSQKFRSYPDGRVSVHPTTLPFFSEANMYSAAEYELRGDGQKWEPCLRSSKVLRATSLLEPCFDIEYQHRLGVHAAANPQRIPYALVVSIKADKVTDLYNRVVRTYRNILVPLRPRLRIDLST
jgi:Subtilase family